MYIIILRFCSIHFKRRGWRISLIFCYSEDFIIYWFLNSRFHCTWVFIFLLLFLFLEWGGGGGLVLDLPFFVFSYDSGVYYSGHSTYTHYYFKLKSNRDCMATTAYLYSCRCMYLHGLALTCVQFHLSHNVSGQDDTFFILAKII